MPFFTGLCGSSSVSHLAWCLRWIATHSRVIIEVVSQPQKRKKWAIAGARLRALLPRQLRRGLVDDGRWLKPDAQRQLQAWVAQRPRMATLVEYRRRLSAVLEARSQSATDTLHALQAWCHEAEATGIRALQDYSARLKGYSLQTA